MTRRPSLAFLKTKAFKTTTAALVSIGTVFTPPFDGHAASAKPINSAHDFTFEMAFGEPLSLKEFAGKTVLIVNTATECGFSGQLSGLQELHERYEGQGLVVLGVPSNDFGGQEPRTNDEIATHCEAEYGATFTMTAKTAVKGEHAHPFYQWAAKELGVTARPYWNFHKYLIDSNGKLVAWFATPTAPTSGKLTSEIERLLTSAAKG
ncbi:glutathione peroxidase [uncultured Roseibium sp.]|uniref:glutathione peroxidase n=1 Tax=uncultured Roseibium sp. TaxID=1936171 RepID=UPI002612675C|nr:glutathione peroxidase [uncultured Roseibium sp.]